jgi:hypothetical protein
MKRFNHRSLSLGLALGLALAGGARADSGEETKTQRKIETKRVERVQTRRAAERRPGERRRVAVVGEDGKDRLIHLDGPMMRRGFLGVVLTDLTPELRTHFGVPDDAGSMVAKVEPGSPAEKAGVKVGDILTSVGGEDIKGSWDVHRAIRKQEDGSQVQLEVWRNGRVQNLTATIEQRERAEIDMAPFFFKDGDGDRLMFRLDRDKLLKGLPEGVEVLPPGEGWKEGEGPRAFAYRLGSPREAELEKRLKELEKRLKELEKQLEKQ